MTMTTAWLHIIGVTEDGQLPATAKAALETADIVYGSARLFELVDTGSAALKVWPSPFSKVFADLAALSDQRVVILATGDPQWFGIGASLLRHFKRDEIAIYPALSAFQLAAARMGWSLQDVETLSIHGRPVETLSAFLYPGARLIALTSDGDTPKAVAQLLCDKGFGQAHLSVLASMGSAEEQRIEATAADWSERVPDFHTLAIELPRTGISPFHARVAGLPDDAFQHDGKMTKREVRAVTLASLQPYPGALLWDIGSGCGSVGIEWMRLARGAKAIGLDPNAKRRDSSLVNARTLGVPDLDIRDAKAPEGLSDLPDPDAIFIGGGLTASGMVEACLSRLKPGGRLVANAVTLESEAVLLNAFQTHGGNLTRLAISHADPVGHLTGWRPAMPVTQWVWSKPHTSGLKKESLA